MVREVHESPRSQRCHYLGARIDGGWKKLFTPTVVEAVANKVIQKPITNFEDLRKLRTILRDLVARAFLERPGAILNLRFCAPARLRVFALRLTGGNEAMLPSRTSDSWSILLTSQYLLD